MNLALAELVARVPRVPRTIAQEIVVVGAALGVVLLSHPTGVAWSEPAALVACCALPLRLKWPWLAMLFCLWGLSGELGLAPALIGIYRIGRTARSPWVTVAWAAAGVVAIETTVFATEPLTLQDGTLSVLFALLWMSSPAGLGMLVATRERLAASLAQLRLASESESEMRAERARRAERNRIGREIHDAVGHHATLIAVEAAALEATTGEPETKAAAGRMRALAKASLGEMRAALGLVGGRSEGAAGLADVAELVAQAGQAGMSVDLESADLADVDVLPAVGRAVFRIVQEALTNAAKHAPGAAVRVVVGPHEGSLVVTVISGPGSEGSSVPDGGGLGLAGMAERATTVGGHLNVERGPGDKFTVSARLPLESYGASKVDATGPTIDGSQAAVEAR
ncbi:MAG TPA: histidine kinase [Pseudonocardiaceae bacterium]|nr:histidine kinase [Pseudonocardiaceae bacterium]